MAKEKIIVGLSGGVDSSVAGLILKERGYQVEGLFMKNWNEISVDGHCMWETDVEDAMHVCDTLNIPLNTVDLSSEYWNKVFENFLAEYKTGRTPNPDILCNQEIKFKAFLEHAFALGADKIATGHYARIKKDKANYQLLKGLDNDKDQSYFLCRLNQSQLGNALFPIGELKKSQVRKKAKQAGFITHDKKDSTGICFVGERPFREFLSHYIPPIKGEIQTLSGKVIGQHDGVFYYTLGQRQGLGIGGIHDANEEPWYVVGKDIEKNILYAEQGHNHPQLLSRQLTATEMCWISNHIPESPFSCAVKTRYRQPDQECIIEHIDDTQCKIRFRNPQRAITPGQFVVFYENDICLGGGIIDSAE